MKKILYHIICAAGLACGFTACSDFLELESLDKIALSNFWNEESDVENMVAGCYTAMQTQSWMDRAIVWGEARSENLVGGERIGDDTSLSNVMMENLNSNNEYTKWITFYEVINRCNLILHYAPLVAEKDPNYTQSELKATMAEATALRSLCYFYLVRAFRDVPYITEPYIEDTQKMDVKATPMMEVLDSLTASLERVVHDAVKRYPETTPEMQTGRMTQDAIHAMLADMYLWTQDYQLTVNHADAFIESKREEYDEELERLGGVTTSGLIDKLIGGYPLIADKFSGEGYYGKAFEEIFGTGNSRESILELTFVDDDAQASNTGVSVRYGSEDGGNGSLRPSELVAGDIADGLYAIYLNKYDVRSQENIYRMSATNFAVAKYASQTATVNVKEDNYTTSGQASRWPKERCHANWIIYRLPAVMLMKAEALTWMVTTSGALSDEDNVRLRQAYALVDAVNRRSYGKSETESALTYARYRTKTNMLNLIYDERNRELMFEGKRWFDLVRRSVIEGNTNYLVTQAARKYTNNKSAAESRLSRIDAIFWPYNEEELKVNRNLKQNPAFGSGEESSIVVN